MTIRLRLNLAIAAIIVMVLGVAMFAIGAVRGNSAHIHHYLQQRSQSQLAGDIRSDIYRHLAEPGGAAAGSDGTWPKFLLEDIEVQVRLAETPQERVLWDALDQALRRLALLDVTEVRGPAGQERVLETDRLIVALRQHYDTSEHEQLAIIAQAGFRAETAIMSACLLAVLGFLVYLLLVRDWLVKPVEVLKNSADVIGRGALQYRVPLAGKDELAQLGRRLEAMAAGLERHQAQLLEARELSVVGELCRNVAHGLRNPLAAIRSSAQMAARRATDPQQSASMGDVVGQVDRMERRIRRLLEFSRPPKTCRDLMTFGELAAEAVSEAHPLAEARGVLLRIEDGCGCRRFALDREQLISAFAELLTNAVHHSDAGSFVRLCGDLEILGSGACLRIRVIDSGCGMAASTCSKAFELFFTNRADGTGVGLAMVQRVVERHGGVVRLASEPATGTTVTIELPDDQERPIPPPPVQPRCSHNGRARLLALAWLASVCAGVVDLQAATLALRATHVNKQALPGGPSAMLAVQPGDQVTVECRLRAWGPSRLRGYQVQLDSSSLTNGSSGSLLGVAGSALIDAARADFAFAGVRVELLDGQGFSGVDTTTADWRWTGGVIDPQSSVLDRGEVYLATLVLEVSVGAAGSFTVAAQPGVTLLRDDSSPALAIEPLVLQALMITVGDCASAADCGDVDGDGVRDEPCWWWSCVAGACTSLHRDAGQADVGGFGGACAIDGTCDINDRFHTQNCFGNQDTQGQGGYSCEPAPPAAINVDAVGFAGSCVLDGICDINDAFAAENCFGNQGTQGQPPFPCSCAPGPEPSAAGRPDFRVTPLDEAALVLKAPRRVAAGELIEVEVYLASALSNLQGYQLHLGESGGRQGGLQLVDIAVESKRRDRVFKAPSARPWSAFNTKAQQMFQAVSGSGLPASAGSHLATFTYRASAEARGSFAVELLYDGVRARPRYRSFLFSSPWEPVAVRECPPAVVEVQPARRSR